MPSFPHILTSSCLPSPSHDSPFCPRGCRECSPKSRLPVFSATAPCMTRPCLPLSTTVPSGSVRHEYIARYAYRVAITNSRILDVTDSNISYDYKDYRKGGKHGVRTLYFVSFVAYFEIVASLFVYIVKRYKSVFLIRKLPLAFWKPCKKPTSFPIIF